MTIYKAKLVARWQWILRNIFLIKSKRFWVYRSRYCLRSNKPIYSIKRMSLADFDACEHVQEGSHLNVTTSVKEFYGPFKSHSEASLYILKTK